MFFCYVLDEYNHVLFLCLNAHIRKWHFLVEHLCRRDLFFIFQWLQNNRQHPSVMDDILKLSVEEQETFEDLFE